MTRPLILLILLLLPVGCMPHRPPTLPSAAVTSELLLSRLRETASSFESMRGMAKISIESGGKSLSGNQVLVAQKPDLLRAETLSPFGNPLLLVAADGKELRVMLPSEGRFLSGEASAGNIRRFTRLPLRLPDLVHLLLAQVPIISFQKSRVIPEDEGFRLTLDGAGRQELLFDRELRLTRSSYYQDEVLLLQVDYRRFAGNPPFPRSMRLEMPAEESEASLNFSEVETNPAIPAERFILIPPPGYVVEPLP